MFLFRLILLILAAVMGRRLYRAFKGAGQKQANREKDTVHTPGEGQAEPGYSDLTEQGIDDADFEEIP